MRHSEETIDRAVEMYRGGQNTMEIAKAIGISDGTVGRWLRKACVSVRPYRETRRIIRKKKYPPEVLAEIKCRYELGENAREIGDRLGLGPTATLRLLREAGAEVRSPCHSRRIEMDRRLAEKRDAAIKDYEGGLSIISVIKKHRIGQPTLKRWLLELGIQIRSQKESYSRTRAAVAKKVLAAGTKRCSRCLASKPLVEFTRTKQTLVRLSSHCKSCQRYGALRSYGLAPEDEGRLLEFQDGRCGICRREFRQDNQRCVDHSHQKGVVRGLLCHQCNHALGMAEDCPVLMSPAMQDYLDYPPAMELGITAIHRKHEFIRYTAAGFWECVA